MIQLKTDRKTLCYRFTVNTKDNKELSNLRRMVKRNNKYSKTKLIVRIMGRGERVKWALQDGRHRGAYNSYLPHRYATSFDVYITGGN